MAGAVVSISSHVARGSVGNRAMVFALERLGFEVWSVPTAILSHHPGHGPPARVDIPDDHFVSVFNELLKASEAQEIAGIVSGYLASPRQAETVASFVQAAKTRWPQAVYLCDPVMGDAGRLYVDQAIADAIRAILIPRADAIVPNAFEFGWLAGKAAVSPSEVSELAKALSPVSLITSVPPMIAGQAAALLVTGPETMLFEHPLVDTAVKGTGDLLAALLLGRKLQGTSWADAAGMALASTYEVVRGTAQAGGEELMLGQMQEAIVAPRAAVACRRLIVPVGRTRRGPKR